MAASVRPITLRLFIAELGLAPDSITDATVADLGTSLGGRRPAEP
jgi:hypothetical protein